MTSNDLEHVVGLLLTIGSLVMGVGIGVVVVVAMVAAHRGSRR